MSNERIGGEFDFMLHHIGFEADYYHPDSGNLQLSRQTVDAYENEKEGAEIFFKTPPAKASVRGICSTGS